MALQNGQGMSGDEPEGRDWVGATPPHWSAILVVLGARPEADEGVASSARQGWEKCGSRPQRRIAGGIFGGTFERLDSIYLNLLCLLSDMNPSLPPISVLRTDHT